MKRPNLVFVVLLIVLLLPSFLFSADADYARPGNPGITGQWKWVGCGPSGVSTAGVFSAAKTEPSATQRTAAYFASNFQVFRVPEKWSYLYFRNSSTTAGDVSEYLICFGDGGDFIPAFKLRFTTGTQANSKKTGSEFAHKLTVTHYLTNADNTLVCSPENNYVAIFGCDRWWAMEIGIVPLTVTHTSYLEIVGHGQ
jgi:hypothetical protein